MHHNFFIGGMAMSKKVVVAQSGISAGQMKDFWRMVEDGTIDTRRFGGFLENPSRVPKGAIKPATLVRAINILGSNKVITIQQAAERWEVKAPNSSLIFYSEATLKEIAEANKVKDNDWRLVGHLGLSFRQQREIRGNKDNDWWLASKEDGWATKKAIDTYHLVNFKHQFCDMEWQEQEDAIAKLGNLYQRTDERVFAEAIQTIFMLTGQRIAEDWYHWGASLASDGSRVCAGRLDSGGLFVGCCWPDSSLSRLCASVVRKFDNLNICLFDIVGLLNF